MKKITLLLERFACATGFLLCLLATYDLYNLVKFLFFVRFSRASLLLAVLVVSLLNIGLFVRGWTKKLSETWKYFGVALLLASVFVMMTAIRAFTSVVAIMISLFITAICLMCVKTREGSPEIAGFIKKSLVLGSCILFMLLLRGLFSGKEFPDLRTSLIKQMQSEIQKRKSRTSPSLSLADAELELKQAFDDANVGYKWLIKPKYENAAFPFSEGLWCVEKDGLWGYVDSADNVVIDFQYLFLSPFRKGRAFVVTSRDENDERMDVLGVIDKKGQYVISPRPGLKFAGELSDGAEFLPFRTQEGKYGFLNLSDEVHIPAVYDAVEWFSEGMAAVKSGDHWGVIDTEGKWIIAPHYRGLKFFWKGYIPFQSNEGLWGLLNVKDEVVFEPQCTRIAISLDRSGPLLLVFSEKPSKINYLNMDFHDTK